MYYRSCVFLNSCKTLRYIIISGALMMSCRNNEQKEVVQPFSWASSTDSLSMVGEGKISRKNQNIYGFAYTIEGDTLFYHSTDRGDGENGIAMVFRTDSGWSDPVAAPFETDKYTEGGPSMEPDGSHLIFYSDRPAVDNNTGEPMAADDFYRVSKSSGWTEITRMTNTQRISEKRAGTAYDGTVYYWTYTRGEGIDFYKGQILAGQIQDTVQANSWLFPDDRGENNPYVDPEKRFILFAMYGREDGFGKEDIYLSLREPNGWSEPQNLGEKINSSGNDSHPYITTDGNKLFISSSRLTSPEDSVDNWNHYVINTRSIPVLSTILNR